MRYRGAHGNDVFNIGAKDAIFLYSGTNNGSDTFHGNAAEQTTILVQAAGTVVGLTSGFGLGGDSVDDIDAGGFSNVRVVGTGGDDVLDFSSVNVLHVGAGFEINGGNNQDVITTSSVTEGLSYRGAHGNDVFHIEGDATFLYAGTNNGSDVFTGNDGLKDTTILVEGDNTVVGLTSGFDADGGGVDHVDVGGFDGVSVVGTGGDDALDFSGVDFLHVGAGFEINGGNNQDVITTSSVTEGLSYRGGHGNDVFHIEGDATFLYSGTNNGSDTFHGNDGEQTTILVESNNTVVGLTSGFGGSDSVDAIDVAGLSGVRVVGTGGDDALDFSDVTFLNNTEGFTIEGGNNQDTITLSEMSDGTYVGGHGNDSFVVGADTNSAIITDFNDIGDDVIDLSDLHTSLSAIHAATTEVGSDVHIDLDVLGGEAGAELVLTDTTESSLDFSDAHDFIV